MDEKTLIIYLFSSHLSWKKNPTAATHAERQPSKKLEHPLHLYQPNQEWRSQIQGKPKQSDH